MQRRMRTTSTRPLGIREDRRRGIRRVLHRMVQRNAARLPRPCGPRHPESGVLVLDVIYILGIIAVFVVVGLIARGVEKL